MVGVRFFVGLFLAIFAFGCATLSGRQAEKVGWEVEVLKLPPEANEVGVTIQEEDGWISTRMQRITKTRFSANGRQKVLFVILFSTLERVGDETGGVTTVWHAYCGPIRLWKKDDLIEEHPVRLEAEVPEDAGEGLTRCSYHAQ